LRKFNNLYISDALSLGRH